MLHNTKSSQIITHSKFHFSRYGIPNLLITDNEPQFSSDKFRQFSKDYNMEHHTSSPLYPQSNGMAERSVQTVKTLLKKAIHDKKTHTLPYWTITTAHYLNVWAHPLSDSWGDAQEHSSPLQITYSTLRLLTPKLYKMNCGNEKPYKNIIMTDTNCYFFLRCHYTVRMHNIKMTTILTHQFKCLCKK